MKIAATYTYYIDRLTIREERRERESSQTELSNKGKMMRKCNENCGHIYI
jgi:hypothetical protein